MERKDSDRPPMSPLEDSKPEPEPSLADRAIVPSALHFHLTGSRNSVSRWRQGPWPPVRLRSCAGRPSEPPLFHACHSRLQVLGAVEIAVLLKQRGILSAVKPVLDLMQARAYHIEPTIYAQALRLVGEAV